MGALWQLDAGPVRDLALEDAFLGLPFQGPGEEDSGSVSHGLGGNVRAGRKSVSESGKLCQAKAVETALTGDARRVWGFSSDLSHVGHHPDGRLDPRGGGFQQHSERLPTSGSST